VGFAALTAGLVLGIRLFWAYPVARLVGVLIKRFPHGSYPDLHWKDHVLVGWAGMRGVVSLAVVLALPLTNSAGEAFPDRSLIIFLTAAVVLVTLVVNGLSLPFIAGAFGGPVTLRSIEQERDARIAILKAPIAEFDRRMEDEKLPSTPADVMWVRQSLAGRLAFVEGGEDPERKRQVQNRGLDLYLQLLRVERRELHRLFRGHKLSQGSFTKIEREIDLEERGARSQIIDKAAAPHRKLRRRAGSDRSP
jgi:CPA1 family monovalent cation:H+ antiporter